MSTITLPKISLNTVMHKIRAENKQTQEAIIKMDDLPELNFNFQFDFAFSLQEQLEKLTPDEIILPNKNSYHINEFCLYHDEPFIKNIFKGLLKRQVDEAELEQFLLFLRQGTFSKKEIIAKIRFSKEGRQKGIHVKGLKLPAFMMLIKKIPLIGFIFKIMLTIIRLPSLVTKIQQLEAHSQIPEVKTEQLANIIDKSLNNTLRYALQETLQTTLENTLTSHLSILAHHQKLSHADLETKASRSELERKAERSELASKVSHAELEHKVDYLSLTSLLEEKVNHQDLDKKLESRVDIASFHKELALRVDYDSLKINLETKVDKTLLAHLDTQTQAHKRQLNDYKINLLDNQRRLNLLLEEARKRLPEPFSEQQLSKITDEETHIFDAMYVAFEDKFRGTRQDIQNRQKVYLPTIKKAIKASDNRMVLDMGCGRGEWLELLQENAIKSEGVDLNCIMIKECHNRGLSAKEADILDYLRLLKPASISAVTGFHIIEHLPFKVLIALFDECLRVLKPGGVIIFETPNPENLLIGGCHFYTDPSHHNPLVPETMRFTIEQRGFEKTEIKRLHKYSDFYETTSDDAFIKAHFYNEMDFAIIGYKV